MPLQWKDHAVLRPPTDGEMAKMEPKELLRLHALYHEAIQNAIKDPYRYGFVLPHWKQAEELFQKYRTLLLLGANRSGKTMFGARTVVKACLENENTLIYAFSQTQETSVLVQQAAVYEYLPAELKKKVTDETHYISYSVQNGFAGNSLVFPNKSRLVFKTYTQFTQNQSILEGMELGSRTPHWINVGAWLDEYLMGLELLDRLYLRLATMDAKLLLTFTPKDGITETVRYYCDGATTLSSRDSTELKRNRPVPYTQENPTKNVGILYFHSIDNPWSGYKSLVEQCQARGDDNYTITALYGVPTKTYTSKFPCFSLAVNVMKHESMDLSDCTRFFILDPAGSKNWFMCWVAVKPDGTWYVYREWPDVSVGDWAEFRSGKWRQGAGAKGLGFGIPQYVDLIRSTEEKYKETIYERLIDPRMGAQKYTGQHGASSIIEDLSDASMPFVPAPGLDVEDGLQALQSKMAYNLNVPIDGTNRPHFFVSDRCQNIIKALQEFTGEDGGDEAWKDPIDVLRYAAIDGIHYVRTTKASKPRTGGY